MAYLDPDAGARRDNSVLAIPTGITATSTEINKLAGVTGGTVAASKGVVVDANKDIGSFRNVTATGLLAGGTMQAKRVVATASGDGALAIADGVVKITKGSAAALTLADPGAGDEGTVMIITAATAYAHTVSNGAGSGFNAGGAGADVATFGGAVGDSMMIVAVAQKWHVVNLTNVTLG